jgi:hypothetical protein
MLSPRLRRPAVAALAALALALASGCGAGPENVVSGKVTLGGGKPIRDGFVTFYGADNKRVTAHITADGRYQLADPPKGPMRVAVSGPLAVAAPKGAPPLVGVPTPEPLPKKYEDPNNGLTANLTGGRQTVDLELK